MSPFLLCSFTRKNIDVGGVPTRQKIGWVFATPQYRTLFFNLNTNILQNNFTKQKIKKERVTIRYQGGKSRIAKPISNIINSIPNPPHKIFVSLFCGSCAIESKVQGYSAKILNDKHEYLIALWQGLQNGYELPDTISEEQYRHIKAHKEEDKILSGFVGFGCSFGGKWFGGYARDKVNTNYADVAKRSLLSKMEILQASTFTCLDYREVELPANSVVYCDSPYAGTTGYQVGKFNREEYWDYMREISREHIVFISEQIAPADFVCIWEKPFTRILDVNKQNQPKVTERLFIHKDSNYLKNM